MKDTLLAVKGIENLGPGGRRATIDVARSLGIDPDWLVSIMSFESDKTFSPKKKNSAGSGATGLIQIMPATAGKLGYTISQLENMSQEEQIRGPVFKYLYPYKGRMKTLGDAYIAVFFPSAIGQPDDYKMPAWVYPQNRGLDSNNDGTISKGEIVSIIRGVYNSALSKPRVEVPDPIPFSDTPSTSVSSGQLPTALLTGEPGINPVEHLLKPPVLEILKPLNCWDKIKGLFK